MTKALKFLPAVVIAGLLAALLVGRPGPPHILLVSIDTLRWDYLGAYGYPEPGVSPTIDWLAENGMVFDQVVVTAGTTVPSHGTMLTGLYPRHHGARSNHHELYPNTPLIAHALGETGYQTGAFVSARFMGRAGDLTRGFSADNMSDLVAREDSGVQPGDETIAQASRWLDTLDADRPVFLFLHLWEVHTPFEASEWSRSRNTDGVEFMNSGLTVEQWREAGDRIRNLPEYRSALQALYAGEVNRVDSILGKFFENWRKRGLLDNTVVVFTADHGERLGEAGRFGHGPTHDEHVIRVPLVIADFRDPEHRRIKTRVGTIDIAPTLADLAGLERRFDHVGYSLLDTDTLDPERPYFAEVELRTSQIDPDKLSVSWYDPDAVAVWAGNLKLESRHGELALQKTFPDNRPPITVDPDSEAIMLNYLSGLIDTFRETELDLTASGLSEEQLEELRGLGYTQ